MNDECGQHWRCGIFIPHPSSLHPCLLLVGVACLCAARRGLPPGAARRPSHPAPDRSAIIPSGPQSAAASRSPYSARRLAAQPLLLAAVSRRRPGHGRRRRQLAREARTALDLFDRQGRVRIDGRDRRRRGLRRLDRRQPLRPRPGRRARSGGSSPRRRGSPPRPPCAAAASTSATATDCSIASTPPPARSCGTFRPTARSTPAPTSTATTSCSARKTRFLYCLDAASGKLVWKYQSQDQIRCFPTVAGRPGLRGRLRRPSARRSICGSGKGVGEVKIDSPTGCSPAVMDGTVFVGTEGHTLLRHRPAAGEDPLALRERRARRGVPLVGRGDARGGDRRLARQATPRLRPEDRPAALGVHHARAAIDSSPVVVGDRVFVGSADGRLYGLSVEDGREALAVRGRRRHRRLARRGRRPAGDRQRLRQSVLLRGENGQIVDDALAD